MANTARFPGATVTETEPERFEGSAVTEVELTAGDGTAYELYVTAVGEILKVEEEGEGLPWIGGQLSLGAALRVEREIYRGVGTEVEPTPFLLYENGPLEIISYDDLSAVYQIVRQPAFTLGVKGVILPEEGYDVDDSDYFEGMEELDMLYQAGLELGLNRGGWEISLGVLQDLSGETDGQEVDVSLAYTTVLGGVQLRPELSVTWLSSDMVDYFYGVSADEARADRAAYAPGSSVEVEAQLLAIKQVGAGVSVVGLLSAAWVASEISGSPLVEDDLELSATLGVMYSF